MILKHGQALAHGDGVHLGKVCKKNFLANSFLKMGSFHIFFNKDRVCLENQQTSIFEQGQWQCLVKLSQYIIIIIIIYFCKTIGMTMVFKKKVIYY